MPSQEPTPALAGATRLQIAGFALLLVAMLVVTLHTTCVSPRSTFLGSGSGWIAAPDPVSTGTVAHPVARPPATDFVRHFTLDAVPAELPLELRSPGRVEAWLNDALVVPQDPPAGPGPWRTRSGEAASAARTGANTLRVRVVHGRGPALLQLRLGAGEPVVESDVNFVVERPGERSRAAIAADDTRRAAVTYGARSVPAAAAASRGALFGLLGVAVLLAVGSLGLLGRVPVPRSDVPWIAGIAAIWGLVFWQAIGLPAYLGYDGPDHLAYVHFLLHEGRLPDPADGAMMYHPPLFYALGALLLAPFGAGGVAEPIVLRILPLASGVAQIALAAVLADVLFPNDRAKRVLAALAAALAPVQIYMASYLSNELLHAALAAAALVWACRLLARGTAGSASLWGVGALLGASVLTKVSSLLLVPVVALFATARFALVDGRSWLRAAWQAAPVSVAAALVCSGFFVRNAIAYGRPVIGNWDLPGGQIVWWQPPGFHTLAYYTSFGTWWSRPYFAGFESFWDGIYATFWIDGLIGGIARWSARHGAFDYGLMTLILPLALPATLMMLGGGVQLIGQSLRGPDLGRRGALALCATSVFVTGFAMLYMTLRLPAYSMAKASYGLSMLVPCCVAFAHASVELDRRLAPRPWLRGAVRAWALTLAGVILFSFLG